MKTVYVITKEIFTGEAYEYYYYAYKTKILED